LALIESSFSSLISQYIDGACEQLNNSAEEVNVVFWLGERMSETEKPNDPETRPGMGVGQVLVILGLILLYGVGGYWLIFEVYQDPEAPWFLKFGVPPIVIGLTILFFTVLIQRMKAAKTDKYTDVED
jgi:hypothetical protein